MDFKKTLPFLAWISTYNSTQFKGDFMAGITVGIVLIPQGIAYALIAGLPPIYGLYAALVPQIVYAIFGTARQVAIGPVAMDSLLVATGVSTLAIVGSDSYIAMAILLAFMVGAIQFLMGVFRLGFLVNLLSKPVITGFTSAMALIIGVNQFRNLFGVQFLQTDQFHLLFLDITQRIATLHIPTTSLGIAMMGVILLLRKVNKRLPSALLVVFIGISMVYFFQSATTGISIVKNIPAGLPSFSVPAIAMSTFQKLLPIAFALVFVGYLEVFSIGKSLEAKQNQYQIQPNQELIALGLSNMVGSFFKSYPTTSSFSRSAINQESGATTGVAAWVAATMVALTLLFFTPIFYYLPKTVLSAIIIVAVFNLIKVQEALFLKRTNTVDFYMLLVTFLATLFLGILLGILLGVVLSLVVVFVRAIFKKSCKLPFSFPTTKMTQPIGNTESKGAVLLFEWKKQLVYINANAFRTQLEAAIAKESALQMVVVEATQIGVVDSTSVAMLKQIVEKYQKKSIRLVFSGAPKVMQDQLFLGGVYEKTSPVSFFETTVIAIDSLQ